MIQKGATVAVLSETGAVAYSGVVTAVGSKHAMVVDQVGREHIAALDAVHVVTGSHVKLGGKEVIKEEDKDGKHFQLLKEEVNTDGQLSVMYQILVDDDVVSESEPIILNVYNQETGWSVPDDFDENKVELAKTMYESGFDLFVESYNDIEEQILTNMQTPEVDEGANKPAEPQ